MDIGNPSYSRRGKAKREVRRLSLQSSIFDTGTMAPPVEQAQTEPENYEERSALNNGMSAAVGSAAAGLFVSAIQNSIQTHDKGAMGVFTRTGSTIALFTAMGGIFSFTDSFVANRRQKNDAFNGAAGGCAAGLVAGANGEWSFYLYPSLSPLLLTP